ncbi:MAG TPA: TonB-dependent receptor [Blastocatellia bacterium]|nr:TonB-dependent receptor [Blastocatellia bacterium]
MRVRLLKLSMLPFFPNNLRCGVRSVCYILSGALAVFVLTASSLAQTPTGGVRGAVKDQSDSVISGARVTVVSKGTGAERQFTTKSDGQYQIGNLPPGEYEVKVGANGFKSGLAPVTVQVGENVNIDFKLEIGATSETIVVTSDTPAVNTSDFKIDGVVNRQQIESLPLNGRNFLQLAMLEPGVSVDATASPGTSANNFFRVSIAGASQAMTRISVDGAAINDRITGGTSQNFSQESVQEFQISTFNYDLSTSVTSVGSVNIVSRSGSNEFHGSAFIYYRDHNIAAFPGIGRDANRFNDPKLNDPFFARRQIGGSLGGPIKKDKLFWFFNFENNNQDGVFTVNNNHAIYTQYDHVAPNPLSAKQANAKFDWKVNEKHNAFIRLSTDNNDNYNPNGGVRMPSNWIVTKNVAAQAQGGLSSVFTPSLVNDLRYSYGFYSAHLNNPTTDDCRNPLLCLGLGGPQIRAGGAFRIGPNDQTPQNRVIRSYQLTDTLSWQKGSHRLRVGGEWEHYYAIGSWAFDEPATISLHDPIDVYKRAFPNGGLTPDLENPGDPTSLLIYNTLPASLKVVSTDRNKTFVPLNPGLLPTAADILRLPLRSFTTGIGDPGQPQPFNRDDVSRNDRLRFFVTDGWRVKPNFTLTYGVAYVFENKLLNHDLDRPPLVSALFNGDLSAPKKDKNNFDPSLGFAWDVKNNGKTVIRGGAGIYHDSNVFYVRLQERFLTGPSGNGRGPIPGTLVPIPGSQTGADFPNPSFIPGSQIPFSGAFLMTQLSGIRSSLQSRLGDGTNLAVRGVEVFKTANGLFDPNTVIGYAANTTIGVQRELKPNLVVTADFIMRRSIHFGGLNETFVYDRNLFERRRVISENTETGAVTSVRVPVIPQCTSTAQSLNPKAICSLGVLRVTESSANFRYTALHVKVDKRFAERYQFTGSYALSRFTGFNEVIDANNLFAGDGYIESDRTHRFTFSGLLELPSYKGSSRFLRGLANTWQVSLISQMVSKPPLNANVAADLDGDGIDTTPLPGTFFRSFGRSVSADKLRELVAAYNADIERRTKPAKDKNGNTILNPDGTPRMLRPRTPKDQILNPIVLPDEFDSGDNFFAQDVRLSRFVQFNEKYKLTLIGEVFNLFNVANLGGYDSNLTSGRFGQPSTRVGQVFGTGGPRAFQFAARLTF